MYGTNIGTGVAGSGLAVAGISIFSPIMAVFALAMAALVGIMIWRRSRRQGAHQRP